MYCLVNGCLGCELVFDGICLGWFKLCLQFLRFDCITLGGYLVRYVARLLFGYYYA